MFCTLRHAPATRFRPSTRLCAIVPRPSPVLAAPRRIANYPTIRRLPTQPARTLFTMGSTDNAGASKPVLFFDIDNCLYPRSSQVFTLMADLIDEYFCKHLNLPKDEAIRLHKEYYSHYGLAIEGLVRHHEIDPLDYNSKVDDAIPLEDLIKPNPALRKMLEDIDRSKVRVWLLTNAYVTHAKRVVRLLEIEDQFEGLTYCDYSNVPFVCKPDPGMYKKAMNQAGVDKFEDCYFVDDSYLNCVKAKELGWNTAHLVEEELPVPEKQASQYQIRNILEIRNTFPQFFKSA